MRPNDVQGALKWHTPKMPTPYYVYAHAKQA